MFLCRRFHHNKLKILLFACVILVLLSMYKYSPSSNFSISSPLRPSVLCGDAVRKYGRHFVVKSGEPVIPHRLHQIFFGQMIPADYHKHILSWQLANPDWEYFFWTDYDAEKLIREKYPKYYDLYKSYNHNLQRSDVIRYFILHQYGGVYADLDVHAFKPLDPFLTSKTCILVPEPTVQTNLMYDLDTSLTNCIMASTVGHPFFESAIKSLNGSFKAYKQNWDVLFSTGPFFLNKTYTSYLDNHPQCRDGVFCNVHVADHKYLVPTFDLTSMKVNVKEICGKPKVRGKQLKACKTLIESNYKNDIPEEAYSNHLWLHLGWNNENGGFKRSLMDNAVNICHLRPLAIMYDMIK